MPQADFYVLPAADIAARQRFICRLAEKIVPQGHQLHVHCENDADARELDNLLWSFRDDSFLPHVMADNAQSAPIIIGWQTSQINPSHVFVNLTLGLPETALSIERVVEVVVQTPEVLTATRQHFRQYKDAGYHINMNDMRKKHRA